MKRLIAAAALTVGLVFALWAQQPAFDVASIKVIDLSSEAVTRNLAPSYVERSDGVTCVCTVSMLIVKAYGVPWQRIDLPSWSEETVVDLQAKAPVGATKAQIPAMLRQLLAERWSLETRLESRETAVYFLKVDEGGLKLRAPRLEEARPKLRTSLGLEAFLAYEYPGGRIHYEGWATLQQVVAALNSPDMGRPVVDRTGIGGEFEILLDAILPAADFGGGEFHLPDGRLLPIIAPSVFPEIQKLGLKLEPARAAVDYLKIVKLNRRPSEN